MKNTFIQSIAIIIIIIKDCLCMEDLHSYSFRTIACENDLFILNDRMPVGFK